MTLLVTQYYSCQRKVTKGRKVISLLPSLYWVFRLMINGEDARKASSAMMKLCLVALRAVSDLVRFPVRAKVKAWGWSQNG